MAKSSCLVLSRIALGCALTVASAPTFAANDAMLQLLEALHKNGTIDDETLDLIQSAAQADEEQNAAAGGDVAKKVSQSLGELGTPSLTPGRF